MTTCALLCPYATMITTCYTVNSWANHNVISPVLLFYILGLTMLCRCKEAIQLTCPAGVLWIPSHPQSDPKGLPLPTQEAANGVSSTYRNLKASSTWFSEQSVPY